VLGNGQIFFVIELDGRSHHVPVQWTPAKKWIDTRRTTNVHLDVGYSDYDSKSCEIHKPKRSMKPSL